MVSFRAPFLLALISAAQPVQGGVVYHLDEPWCDTMQVTFVDGLTDTLKYARFEFPGGSHNYLSEHEAYLPLFQQTQHPRLLLIHLSKIAEATFETKGSALEVRAMVDGGIVLSGNYAEPETEVVGAGELGKVKVKLKNVRSMRFVEFRTGLLREGPALRRNIAAGRWWASLERARREWTIVDAGDTLKGEGWLGLLDSFSVALVTPSGRVFSSSAIYVTRSGTGFRSNIRSDAKARDAIRELDLDLLKLTELEITGKADEKCYEAIITTGQGRKQPVCLFGQTADSASGPFEELDYLLWGKTFGFEGVPWLPARKITVTEVPPAKPAERKPPKKTGQN